MGTNNRKINKKQAPAKRFKNNGHVTRETLEDLCAGIHQAYDIIYLTYKEKLEEFLSKLTGSRDAANEILQVIFVYLWEKRESINPDQSIKGYLFTAAKNEAIRYMKRNRQFSELPSGYENLEGNEGIAPDQDMIAEETRLMIEIAISNMPEQRRMVYKMSLDGFSYEQIAQKLKITQENARKHVSLARKDLDQMLYLIYFFMLLP